MKTVYVVIGWYTGEEEFIASLFETEEAASEYCTRWREDDPNYQYRYERWEVK